MPTSQNGWPVVADSAVTDRTVFGVEFPNGWLKGDVDTVFTHLIGRLHHEVEPIDDHTPRPPLTPGGCWGWFVKRIEGSATISNHASGTAIDYNAPAHPMGSRNTYSAADQAKIRAILADLDGVVRWGGDYTGRPDDMHFEIHADRAAVARVADRIREQEDDMAISQEDFNERLSGALKNPAIAQAMRALPWQYVGGGIPKGMSTLGVLAGTYAAARAAAGDDVDESAIIAGVLAGLDPRAIAAAIPADLAQRVADELHARLQG